MKKNLGYKEKQQVEIREVRTAKELIESY